MNLKFYGTYDSLIEECQSRKDSIFRGHCNNGDFWTITSSYFRYKKNNYSNFFNRKKPIGTFIKQFSGLDHIDKTGNYTEIQLLTLLQHYGVPTPLIDFTNDVKIALYFAASEISYCVRSIDEHLISRRSFFNRNPKKDESLLDNKYNEAIKLNSKCVSDEESENDLKQLFEFQADYFIDIIEVDTVLVKDFIQDLSDFKGAIGSESFREYSFNLKIDEASEKVCLFSVLNPNCKWNYNLEKQGSAFLFLDCAHDFESIFRELFNIKCITHHLLPKPKLNYPDSGVNGRQNVNSYLKDKYGISGMTLFNDFQGIKYEYLNYETGN